MELICRICSNRLDNHCFAAQEMMFGTHETFDYFMCAACGSLQIITPPENLARHYPPHYYSLAGRPDDYLRHWSLPFKRWIKRRRMGQSLGEKSLLGQLALQIVGEHPLAFWFSTTGVSFSSRILDVGCGGGDLLVRLYLSGFSDLTGVDPHIAASRHYCDQVRIYKGQLEALESTYDFIMMHHALEHVWDPLFVLRTMYRLLNPGGSILIRIPVANTLAWHKYGRDWVQLDAPRHLLIPSERGMGLLAKQAGFRVVKVIYDSTALMFLGSEHYRRDIPLTHPTSHFSRRDATLFPRQQIDAWEQEAKNLNHARDGDQACFFLVRSD